MVQNKISKKDIFASVGGIIGASLFYIGLSTIGFIIEVNKDINIAKRYIKESRQYYESEQIDKAKDALSDAKLWLPKEIGWSKFYEGGWSVYKRNKIDNDIFGIKERMNKIILKSERMHECKSKINELEEKLR